MGVTTKRKEYLRNYNRAWIAKRRQRYINEYGPCKVCGSWENLEIHHRNPETKTANSIWSWRDERIREELTKCDILCEKHHQEETSNARRAKMRHGMYTMYDIGCRCEKCRKAHAIKNNEYRKKNRNK